MSDQCDGPAATDPEAVYEDAIGDGLSHAEAQEEAWPDLAAHKETGT